MIWPLTPILKMFKDPETNLVLTDFGDNAALEVLYRSNQREIEGGSFPDGAYRPHAAAVRRPLGKGGNHLIGGDSHLIDYE